MQVRKQFGSTFSYIVATTGSAFGIRNIWKFPSVAGENGGAASFFLYRIGLLVVGAPVFIAESF